MLSFIVERAVSPELAINVQVPSGMGHGTIKVLMRRMIGKEAPGNRTNRLVGTKPPKEKRSMMGRYLLNTAHPIIERAIANPVTVPANTRAVKAHFREDATKCALESL